jgi:extracellular factor (EF) 3-hydroxypalmitic acid methyl ester biosynthesis protein
MSTSLFPHLVKKFDGDPDVDQLKNGHFRSHRYLAADLRPLRPAVTLTIAGSEMQCELIDLSERGISIRWDGLAPAETVVASLAVRFDGYLLFKGAARIVSLGERHGAKALALDFASPAINVPELLDLRAIKQWQSTASGGSAQRTVGHELFKAQIAELSLLLRDAQQELGKLEQTQPWTSLAAEDDLHSISWQAFADAMRGTFVQGALKLMEKIDPGEAAPGLRSFSHRFIHSFLMESPTMRRAAEKPLGYPGDYHLMSAIQEQRIDGTSLFAKAMSLLFNELPFTRAMRSRGLFIQRSLQQLIAARSTPLRVFAIAPGSADELIALVSSLDKGVRVDVVVVDHDGASLTHIHDRVLQLKKERPDSGVTFTLRHEGVKHLLSDPGAMDGFGDFDFIYSTTLFDYLRPQTFTALMQLLGSRLKPQGTLLVNGFSPELWDRWLLELHLDWQLFYRTPEELLSLAAAAVPNLRCSQLEAGDNNLFIKVTS